MKKILIVDDEPLIRNVLKRIMTSIGGWKINVAEDGEDASVFLKFETYDLVIMDLIMPGKTGMDLLERANFGKAKIVAISGYPENKFGERLLEKYPNISKFIKKPFTVEEITEMINKDFPK